MGHRGVGLRLLALALVWALGENYAQAQSLLFRGRNDQWEKVRAVAQIPWHQLPPQLHDKLKSLLECPTLFTHGPAESFVCHPVVYHWLLDNPDKAALAWKRLGVGCLDIQRLREGPFPQFTWADDQSGHIWWQAIHSGPTLRIWYAEGKVRPAPLLPQVPVRCAVLLRHQPIRENGPTAVVQHQADVFVHTDSTTTALVLRMMGPSAPRLAEQAVGQLQMFFAALAWYIHQHPHRSEQLLGVSLARPDSSVEPASLPMQGLPTWLEK